MEHNLEFLAGLLYKTGIPQHIPSLHKPAKEDSYFEYNIFSPNVRIRALRECIVHLKIKKPTTITVLGGYQNIYEVSGPKNILDDSRIIFLAGVGNILPHNIPVITKGGVYY
jgi:hypothetical protein